MALRTMLARSPHARGCVRGPGIACLYFLLAVFVLVFVSVDQASAAWRELWSEDFETRTNAGLKLETFGPTDRLIVAVGGPNKCRGYMLKGESKDASSGNGFRAASPAFSELGMNPANPYHVSFQYMVPDDRFCWTYALATRDACLVVAECDGTGDKARLGLVDHLHQNFQSLGTLNVGQWHKIDVLVGNVEDSSDRFVRVIVDGVSRGVQLRPEPSRYDRVLFMDLPARISDVGISDPIGGACFGSGNWDEIRLWSGEPSDLRRDKAIPEIQVAPSPFNPTTQVKFDMRGAGLLNVDVYDIGGRHVRNLYGGHHASGPVQLIWRGRNDRGREVASGVYIIRVATPLGLNTNRAVLVR